MTGWNTSPSLHNLMLCEARAVAKYIAKTGDHPEPPKAAEGKRLHAVVQHYLTHGVVPDVDDIAAHAMLRVLPVKAGCIDPNAVEAKVTLPGYTGYIDFCWLNNVGDLKWTSNVKYQKDVDPEADPQRIIYAANQLSITRSDRVNLYWCVAQFDGKNALVLKNTWSAKLINQLMVKHIIPVRKKFLEHLEQNTPWQDAPKTLERCHMYPPLGCFNLGTCKRTITQLIKLRLGDIKK